MKGKKSFVSSLITVSLVTLKQAASRYQSLSEDRLTEFRIWMTKSWRKRWEEREDLLERSDCAAPDLEHPETTTCRGQEEEGEGRSSWGDANSFIPLVSKQPAAADERPEASFPIIPFCSKY